MSGLSDVSAAMGRMLDATDDSEGQGSGRFVMHMHMPSPTPTERWSAHSLPDRVSHPTCAQCLPHPSLSWTNLAIYPPSPPDDATLDATLACPTLRDSLKPRASPFLSHNYFGGGFGASPLACGSPALLASALLPVPLAS